MLSATSLFVGTLFGICLVLVNSVPLDKQKEHKTEILSTKNNIEDNSNVHQEIGCKVDGVFYRHGEGIATNDGPCNKCFCFRDQILCWKMTCLLKNFTENCKEIHADGLCCPLFECENQITNGTSLSGIGHSHKINLINDLYDTKEDLILEEEPAKDGNRSYCKIKDKQYFVGEVVKETGDPCIRCICAVDGKLKCEPLSCAAAIVMDESPNGSIEEGLMELPPDTLKVIDSKAVTSN